MVLTRLQEQLLQTPPGAGPAGGVSPATPADGGATPVGNGRQPLPLKSALKTRLRRHGSDGGGEGGEATPLGAGVKKTVRIHSSSNLIHEFQASGTTDDYLLSSDGEDGQAHGGSSGGTPDSSSSRGRRPRARRPPPASLQDLFLGSLFGSGSGGSRRSARQRASAHRSAGAGGGSSNALGVAFTLAWMAASSALIFMNKVLMVDRGFRYPAALTCIGQATSMLLAYAVTLLGLAPLRPPPSPRVALTALLPVSASFAASLFLGNYAYLGLSVAFVNICKAATPLATLAVGLAARLEPRSKLTLLATLLIAGGTALATAAEASTGHFAWVPFLAFAASVVFEGVRVVLTERLLGQERYNVMEALVYLGPLTVACLAAGSYVLEWRQGLATDGLAMLAARRAEFGLAAVVSFLVNLLCYLAIRHVSATTFKVAGCLKNVAVVWGGILSGDVVAPRELQGYGVSLVGFLLYSLARLRRPSGGHSGDSDGGAKKAQ